MANQKLQDVFWNTKHILCEYDYYIHISKKIIYVTNSENMIPHLMGLQYLDSGQAFTGDKGVYLIKKLRLKYTSLEKIVKKYYPKMEKAMSILAMIKGKIENLYRIEEMLTSKSNLYIYDAKSNPMSELKTNYLIVNEQEEMVLQLGLIKAKGRKEYHCNTFMIAYRENANFNVHYRNLTHFYEIQKIVRENKRSRCREVIYQSEKSRDREKNGINKMLENSGMEKDEKLIEEIYNCNVKYGKFHNVVELEEKGIVPKSTLSVYNKKKYTEK